MPSVGYLQQLQKVFVHFKKNGGVHRPACCSQIELVDEDDLRNWYVQLVYKAAGSRGSAKDTQNEDEEFIVNLHLRFLDDEDDNSEGTSGKRDRHSYGVTNTDAPERTTADQDLSLAAESTQPSSSKSPHHHRPQSAAPPSRMPLVFIHSPRLVAPFIHFGALCALELMSQSNWSLTPLNMELLLIALHETLDPFAAGSSVQVLAEGVGQGLMGVHHPPPPDLGDTNRGAGSLAGVSRYTAQEHLDGIRLIRRAHPHLFRSPTTSHADDEHVARDEQLEDDLDSFIQAGGASDERHTPASAHDGAGVPILRRPEEIASFFQEGHKRFASAAGLVSSESAATRVQHHAVVDQVAVAQFLHEQCCPTPPLDGPQSIQAATSSSSQPSLLVVAPSTMGQPWTTACCSSCPSPGPVLQHAVTAYLPPFFARRAGDRVCFTLTGAHPLSSLPDLGASLTNPTRSAAPSQPSLPSSAREVAVVLRQAPSDASPPQSAHSPHVTTCIIREGCSLTLRNLIVYGHLRVRGTLTLIHCVFIGTLETEREARVSLRGCDIALATQDRLLLPSPPRPVHPPPPPQQPPHDLKEARSPRRESAADDLSLDIQSSRHQGILVLDSSEVEVLDGCVVSRAVPFSAFTPSAGGSDEAEWHSGPGVAAEVPPAERRERAPSKSPSSGGRRRSGRPRFCLRHGKTHQEHEEARLFPIRALILVSNHARLRVADSALSPRQPSRCPYTIMAENDASVDLCSVVVAAGRASAITLQGCRGHCERVLVTSPDALLLAFHRAAHSADGGSGATSRGEVHQPLARPHPPPPSLERKSTGINVELGGVVTAKYCVAEYVYFGFCAIAQSVANFHGCHAKDVVNGFTVDASTVHMGRCSTQATHVGLFVLNKAKCVLSEDVDPKSAPTQHEANDSDSDEPISAGEDGTFGQRCRLVKELSCSDSDENASSAAPLQSTVERFLSACAAAATGNGAHVAAAEPQMAASGDTLQFVLRQRGDHRIEDGGLQHGITAGAVRALHAYLTTAASPDALGVGSLQSFCLFVGGEHSLEVNDALVEATGAVLISPRDTGVLALGGGELVLREVIVWNPSSAYPRTPHVSDADAGEAQSDSAGGTAVAEATPSGGASQGGYAGMSARARKPRSTYGLSLKDCFTLQASSCLVVGFAYSYLVLQGSSASLSDCMAAGCVYGYVVSSRAYLSAAFCGATATSGAVLVMEGAQVSLTGVPHVVGDGDVSVTAPHTSHADASEGGEAFNTTPRQPPRVICGGCYLSVYRGGNTAVECRGSTLSCVGVVVLRGDSYGFDLVGHSSAKLANCLVDVSPCDAARFLCKGLDSEALEASARARGRCRTLRQLLLDDGGCFDPHNPRPAPPTTDTERIATCAVRVSAGSVCEAVEMEIRFAAAAFLASGPESILCARRCRVRHVMTGFHADEGATAVLVRCRCDATYGVLVLPHARCTVVNGRYASREVGFDNVGGLLRILGHVKVCGGAQVGVRLDEGGCLEAMDSALPPAAPQVGAGPEAQGGTCSGDINSDFRQALLGAEADTGGVPTRLEVRLGRPQRALGASAIVPRSTAENDDAQRSPWLSETEAADAHIHSRSSKATAPIKRSDYPVCLLLSGGSMATVHNGVFSGQAEQLEDIDHCRGPSDSGSRDVSVSYGLRAVGRAQAVLVRCRFDKRFREACVRAGAGSRVSLMACEVLGGHSSSSSSSSMNKRTVSPLAQDDDDDEEEEAGNSHTGSWYALEIHRGAVCTVQGAPGVDRDAPRTQPRPHLCGPRAVWSRWCGLVRHLIRRLGRWCALLFRGPRGGNSPAAAASLPGSWQVPWYRRRFTREELWQVSWMRERLGTASTRSPQAPPEPTAAPQESPPRHGLDSAGLSVVQGRCLVTGCCTFEGVVFLLGSVCALPAHSSTGAAATQVHPSVQLDVAKGGSLVLTRCFLVVSPPSPPPVTAEEAAPMPLLFARNTGTTVRMTTCVVCAHLAAPVPLLTPSRPLCLLRLGEGARATITLLTSAHNASEALWPTASPPHEIAVRQGISTPPAAEREEKGRFSELSALPLSLHVSRGTELHIEASILHSLFLLSSPSRDACADGHRAKTLVQAVHCLFSSARPYTSPHGSNGGNPDDGFAVLLRGCSSTPH